MMKIIRLLLLFMPMLIQAQEYAPIGAVWHYSKTSIQPGVVRFEKLESIADTIVDGMACKKIKDDNFFQYFMERNDSTFFYSFYAHQFCLLYDFNAQIGDSITLGQFITAAGAPLKYFVADTGSIMINGHSRRTQRIYCGDGLVIEFSGTVIQGIGNMHSLFPISDGDERGQFRCYQDDSIGLYINPTYTSLDCEHIFNDIVPFATEEGFEMYPNPINDYLTLKYNDKNAIYNISSIVGESILHGKVALLSNIDCSLLDPGVYVLTITSNKNTIAKKLIKD